MTAVLFRVMLNGIGRGKTDMNGAEVVAEILKREGTEFLSCYPRNPIIEPCAALDIRPILCRQERVGVGLADGYTRIKRGKKNGVFAAQAGPGIENAFPGIAQAYAENVPLLIVSGGLPLARQYVRPVFRAADVYRPVTKWSALAHIGAGTARPDAPRLSRHAPRQGRPGADRDPGRGGRGRVQGRARLRAGAGACASAPDPDAVKKAVQMLLAAKNPVLWAGQGVHYAEAGERARGARRAGAGAGRHHQSGQERDPGEPSAVARRLDALARARCTPTSWPRPIVVFAIGSSLTKTPFGPGVPPGKTIIHSTNDAGDINKEYRVDHAVVGDAALVLDALIAEVGAAEGRSGGGNALTRSRRRSPPAKKAWLGEWAKFLDSDETPLNQYRVIRDLMRTVDRDNVIMTHDSGSPREQMMPFWETTTAGSYMGWGKSTQLGYGLGITMGAKLAAPNKLCVNVMGDAAIGMTGMDIETAARNRIAHPHRGVQQRRDGRRARRAEDLRREIRLDDGRRQLHQGRRGAERRRAPGREARRHRVGASRRRSASPKRARRSCSNSWSRKAATSRATTWPGL